MEGLCGLFEAVVCFGEIMGRCDEKAQELASLTATMESISASVKAFADDLAPEERAATFHSNKVFPELLKHLKQCEEVVKKRCKAIEGAAEQAAVQDAPSYTGVASAIKRGLRSWSREAVEVVSGKVGALSSVLQLPDDELAVIRSTASELQKLVPLLNLAITAHSGSRGRRSLSASTSSILEPEPPLKRPRLFLEDSPGAGDRGGGHRMLLQLVSDSPAASSCSLPALKPSDLRPATGTSTTSLETASGSESGAGSAGAAAPASPPPRRLFGRQELRERVPREFVLPVQNGLPRQLQHVSRFVSRDLFTLEEALPAPAPTPRRDAQATLDMPTLEFGLDVDDSGTLPMGAPMEAAGPLALATAKGCSSSGLHCRSSGQTLWRWVTQDTELELFAGDRISILMESPPGSFNPGPARDLEAHEVTCLLGVELRLPKQSVMPF